MDSMRISPVMLLLLSFTVGCSGHDPAPPPPSKTVFDPLTQQVDKARGVQNTVDANQADTRRSVERQERGDGTP
ncbi:MAG: hypothetical protein NVSMB10_05880 [Steroidobacteraceae bacterium]